MVLKLRWHYITILIKFENDVNVYGTQAPERNEGTQLRFENDVNMYGTQANPLCLVVSRPV